MRLSQTAVLGAYVVEPEPRVDARGSFARVFSADEFQERGLPTSVVQANLATTLEAGSGQPAAYDPVLERGVHHADPAIGIAWPREPRNLSSKDLDLPLLRDAELPDVDPS